MKKIFLPICLLLAASCSTSTEYDELPVAEEYVIRDVQEMEVCDFRASKYVWMHVDQSLLTVGGSSWMSVASDIVLPVDMVFVGKVDVAEGIKVSRQDDGTYLVDATTRTRLISATPDYVEMERLSRMEWYNLANIVDDEMIDELTSAAIDSVLIHKHQMMLDETDSHARTALKPIITSNLHLSPDAQIEFRFKH